MKYPKYKSARRKNEIDHTLVRAEAWALLNHVNEHFREVHSKTEEQTLNASQSSLEQIMNASQSSLEQILNTMVNPYSDNKGIDDDERS